MSPESSNLAPFSRAELKAGSPLLLKRELSSIRNDVEALEGSKLKGVLRSIETTVDLVRLKTDHPFALGGSMAMHVLVAGLPPEDEELAIQIQRLGSSKADLDALFSTKVEAEVMDAFGWNDEAKGKKRDFIDGKGLKVDVLGVTENHLPWEKVTLKNGKEIFVQSPFEMIFEKMQGLIDPGKKDDGTARPHPEAKWGVDVKILKAYLIEKNGWSEEVLNAQLKEKWQQYCALPQDQESSGKFVGSFEEFSQKAEESFKKLMDLPVN